MEGGEPSEHYASGAVFIISTPMGGHPSLSSSIYFEIFGQRFYAFMRFGLPLLSSLRRRYLPPSRSTCYESYIRRDERRNPGPQKTALID